MEHEINRDHYLEQLIKRKNNGLIKIVTGIRRCGKSFLLRTLFKKHLTGQNTVVNIVCCSFWNNYRSNCAGWN